MTSFARSFSIISHGALVLAGLLIAAPASAIMHGSLPLNELPARQEARIVIPAPATSDLTLLDQQYRDGSTLLDNAGESVAIDALGS